MAVKWLYFLIAPLGDADGKKSYFVMPFSLTMGTLLLLLLFSASEVKTLWRYTNLFISIIIFLL